MQTPDDITHLVQRWSAGDRDALDQLLPGVYAELRRLARSADAIRVAEVLAAVEETVSATHTGAGVSGGLSGSRAQSLTNRLWQSLSANVYVFLHQTRLSDVIRNDLTPCPAVPNLFRVVDEE